MVNSTASGIALSSICKPIIWLRFNINLTWVFLAVLAPCVLDLQGSSLLLQLLPSGIQLPLFPVANQFSIN